ncbi:MAG TPA: SRPBCC family protein [Gaiellaceae bacterium]|nr:SRPBCC family protein [Gaiellaceae bacterium]
MIHAAWRERIARPVEAVFDYVADLDHEPEWNPDASNVVRTTPGELGLGTVWEEDVRRGGHFVTTIDGFERPHELSFDARSPRTDARVRFTFAPADDGATVVSCAVELTSKGLQRLLEPLLAGTIRRRIESSRGPALKRALEGSAAAGP